MTLPAKPASGPATGPNRGFTVIGLVVAFAATGALVIGGGPADPQPPAQGGRVSAAAAWPIAKLSTIADLPLRPLLFLDTATVLGTAPSDDDGFLRLLLRKSDGTLRELRRRATAERPRFENLTSAGNDVVWTEFSDSGPPQIWAASMHDGSPARRLTDETGNVLFYGSQYDLLPHEGRVYWTAQPDDGSATTEVRSVALSGGRVEVTQEKGEWTMAAWPWLDDGASAGSAATLLRDRSTGREVTVPTTGAEFPACSPSWCRVMVTSNDSLARVDLMRPDGSARRQIAEGTVRAAVPDVAILDRFELLAEPGPQSGATGTAALLAYDIRTGETVELTPAANDAQSRGGLVWWYTSSGETAQWHVFDLRTV